MSNREEPTKHDDPRPEQAPDAGPPQSATKLVLILFSPIVLVLILHFCGG